ncbi:MAG: hypothetical protein Q8N47_06540 [Bryobacterales bacterium]|nr:hypothetical protein [Bryobacterales bacterium]
MTVFEGLGHAAGGEEWEQYGVRRQGTHDDLVFAVALAYWAARKMYQREPAGEEEYWRFERWMDRREGVPAGDGAAEERLRERLVRGSKRAPWRMRAREAGPKLAGLPDRHWREDHVFSLQQALRIFDAVEECIATYELEIHRRLKQLSPGIKQTAEAPPVRI